MQSALCFSLIRMQARSQLLVISAILTYNERHRSLSSKDEAEEKDDE
jgi:hypothetical protein